MIEHLKYQIKLCSIINKNTLTGKRLESNFCNWFNSFSTSTCFVLLEVIFYLKYLGYHHSLSVFLTKLGISFMLVKFGCVHLEQTFLLLTYSILEQLYIFYGHVFHF